MKMAAYRNFKTQLGMVDGVNTGSEHEFEVRDHEDVMDALCLLPLTNDTLRMLLPALSPPHYQNEYIYSK